MNDTQQMLGKLIESPQERDAIHIAVAPVVAGAPLSPGQHIGFLEGGRVGVVSKPIGIVDPFLKKPVLVSQTFWLFLYPNTITGLRHKWVHSEFDGDRAKSELWLRRFAADNSTDYNEMVNGAATGTGVWFGMSTPFEEIQPESEFWQHIENVTGKKLSNVERQDSSENFRCSC